MTRSIPMTMLLLWAGSAVAGQASQTPTPAALWKEECAACHMAYPARLLPAESWKAIMAGLKSHFGTDATVDAPAAAAIERFLVANAGMRAVRSTGGPVPLRITTSPWFIREHREVAASTWKRPEIKSPSNCTACHTGAESNNFSDDRSGASGGRRR